MPASAPMSAPTAPGIPGAAPVTALPNNGGAAPSQALLVSSSPAQSATAANVTKLQTITAPAPAALQPAVNAVNAINGGNNNNNNGGSTNTQPVQQPTVLPQSTTSTQSPTQTTTQQPYTPPQGATQTTLPGGVSGYYTPASADGTTPESMTDANGNTLTYSQAVGGWIDPSTGAAPVQAPVSPAGTGTSGTTSPYDAAVASISDPGIAAQYSAALATQDQEAQTLQATITSLQGATAATDPATMAAVAAIQQKYNALINAMQAKNTQIIGRASTEAAAFGGLGVQGNGIDGTFMSNETADAQQRISTLQDQEQSLILQAQAAFSANNSKALNDAMTQYDTINQQKITALNDLLTSMGKQVTENQAQQKIDLTSTKDQVSNDIAQSTKIAAGIAANISASGLTDPTQIQAYIAGIAAQYGISNPDILYSQVVTAGQTTAKNNASVANTQDEIANRDTGTVIKQENEGLSADRVAISASKASTGTAKQQNQTKLSAITQAASTGYVDPSDGVPFSIQGSDGNYYLTQVGFQKLSNAAAADGIPRTTFLGAVQQYLSPDNGASYGLSAAEITRLGLGS